MATNELIWHRVLAAGALPEGRVKTVTAGRHSLALTHYEGRYAALSNGCPHQGGPLERLAGSLGEAPVDRVDQRGEVAERWSIWRGEKASRVSDDRGCGVSSAAVFAALGRHVPTDAVIAVASLSTWPSS
jgi:hypothetical protein